MKMSAITVRAGDVGTEFLVSALKKLIDDLGKSHTFPTSKAYEKQ